MIHNAAVGYQERHRLTVDGVPHLFAINTLAPYILTALMERPDRLVYLSSGLHHGVDANLDDIFWRRRPWNGGIAYSESKLHDVLLAFAVARRWPGVRSNALEPGWVATKMGGPGATDDLAQGHLTQAWLAASDDSPALGTAGYFYHMKPRTPNPQARDVTVQEQLLGICREVSGIALAP
ncbi:MAG: short-chain dehydrogenase [Alphaproteobacteria bacterium]|nr:short-chain dehydrogenase [Alphaproteobacteria bacterium]